MRGFGLFGMTVLLLVAAVGVGAQEGKEAGGMPPMGPPEEMKALEQYNGVWDVDFKFKMDPTAEEWTETKALCTYKMILDGAVQQMEFTGEMMGMKFVGYGWYAYDRENKTWQTTWSDNMGARISMYTGEIVDGNLVFTGTDKMQGMEIHSRVTTTPVVDGKFEWTYEMSMDGETYMPSGSAVYTKR